MRNINKMSALLFSAISLFGITITSMVGVVINQALNNDEQNEENISEIKVYLNDDYYSGEILRNNSRNYDLTQDLFPIKDDFNGWLTNNNFSRNLDAVELRNGDALIVKIQEDKIDNWTEHIRWVDTLSTKGFSLEDQSVTFEMKDNKWVSRSRLAYLDIKNSDSRLFNNNQVCFSKGLYESLTTDEKNRVSTIVNSQFYTYVTNSISGRENINNLEQLNDDEWARAQSYGTGSFSSCFQKVKEGEVIVEKMDSTTLKFVYNGLVDYNFLENNNNISEAKYIMSYSFLQAKANDETWHLITGILFSNLDTLKIIDSSELSNFAPSIQQSSSLLSKYDSASASDIDSNWKEAIDSVYIGSNRDNSSTYYCSKYDCSNEVNEFKRVDESFAGLYRESNLYDESTFYKWYRS